MKKKMIIGIGLLLAIAIICFGLIFAFLFFSDNSDDTAFVSSLQNNVVGFWYALACDPVGDGTAFDSDGRNFEFTDDFVMKYYEYSVELENRRANYSWRDETTMLVYTPANQSERSFLISFDAIGNLLVEDLGFHVIWTLSKNAPEASSSPYLSPFHDRVLGTWNAIYCERNGEEFPYEGKAFSFGADMVMKYSEDGVEITDRSCIFNWTADTVLLLRANSGEVREWLLSTNDDGNLIIQDDSFGLVWTLQRGE